MSKRMREMLIVAGMLGAIGYSADELLESPYLTPRQGRKSNKYTPHQGKRECARRKAKS